MTPNETSQRLALPLPQRRPATARAIAPALAAALAVTVLAGCASAPSRFYTLSADTPAAGDTAQSRGAAAPATPYAIEVPQVSVPDQVDRPQIVVTRTPGEVDILEESRWSQPLKNELTATISRDLTRRLGAMDIYGLPHQEGLTVYRVSTAVQRFESSPGKQAALTAVWTVRKVPGDVVLTCRFDGTQASAGGIDSVVAAQRQLVDRLADGIGNAIDTSARGATPRCQ